MHAIIGLFLAQHRSRIEMSSSGSPSPHCHKKHHCHRHWHCSNNSKISSLLKSIRNQVTENHKSTQDKMHSIAQRVTIIEQQNTPSVETAQSAEKTQSQSAQSAENTPNTESVDSRGHPTQIAPQPARLPSSWRRTPATSTMAHPSGPIEMWRNYQATASKCSGSQTRTQMPTTKWLSSPPPLLR